jgi:hypothetical protein
MNENTQKLVDALRSGKYKQGHGRLREGDEYCCLGVACDISGLGAWESERYANREDAYLYRVSQSDYDASVLPNTVREWLGWTSAIGEFAAADEYADEYEDNALTELNDGGMSFDKIADQIEASFDYLSGEGR